MNALFSLNRYYRHELTKYEVYHHFGSLPLFLAQITHAPRQPEHSS